MTHSNSLKTSWLFFCLTREKRLNEGLSEDKEVARRAADDFLKDNEMNILELAVHSDGKDPRKSWYIVRSDKDHRGDLMPHNNEVIEYVLGDNVLRRGIVTSANGKIIVYEFSYPTHPNLVIYPKISLLRDIVMWRYLDRDNNPVPVHR